MDLQHAEGEQLIDLGMYLYDLNLQIRVVQSSLLGDDIKRNESFDFLTGINESVKNE